jgi:hypothetical protein
MARRESERAHDFRNKNLFHVWSANPHKSPDFLRVFGIFDFHSVPQFPKPEWVSDPRNYSPPLLFTCPNFNQAASACCSRASVMISWTLES